MLKKALWHIKLSSGPLKKKKKNNSTTGIGCRMEIANSYQHL